MTSEVSRQHKADRDHFNINVFLDDSDDLLILKRKYDEEKKLIHDERIEVANIISDELIRINYKMCVQRFIEISKQIATVFELEDVVNENDDYSIASIKYFISYCLYFTKENWYQKKNGKNTGILYIQYYNRLAAANKIKKKKDLKRRREPSPEPDSDVSIALNGNSIYEMKNLQLT